MNRKKYKENKSGIFYVDVECIACDTCSQIAPLNFKLTDDYDHAYVCEQPKNDVQLKQCKEALEMCPVDAIGSDNEMDD